MTSGKFGMFGSASGSGISFWSSTWVSCCTGSVSVAGTVVVAGGVFFNTRDELSVVQFVEGTLITELSILKESTRHPRERRILSGGIGFKGLTKYGRVDGK